ncbi:hypothetical protein BIW11_07191, partial [Tropilaelaps mercedesae]
MSFDRDGLKLKTSTVTNSVANSGVPEERNAGSSPGDDHLPGPDGALDSSALTSSVYGTPRTQCSSASEDSPSPGSCRDNNSLFLAPPGGSEGNSIFEGGSSSCSSSRDTPTTRQRSTINVDKYELA